MGEARHKYNNLCRRNEIPLQECFARRKQVKALKNKRKGAATIVLALLMSFSTVAQAAAPWVLFGTNERRSSNLKAFKKWTGALGKYSREIATLKQGDCKEKTFNQCHYDEWMAFIKGLEGLTPLEKVKKVNAYMNRAKYITDPVNWGKKDYWATPGEFILNFGDCEDYAIAKFMTLRKLGFSSDDLRVVAVKDLNLKVGHAILAVRLKEGIVILDNQIKIVTNAERIHHYVPVFSINETAWWRHRK